MTRHLRTWTVGCTSVLVAVVTGCGSGSSSGDTASAAEHAFFRSVDAVCAKAVAAHAGHEFPVQGFDPESPDPSQLPAVGDYFAQYGGLPTTTAGLHALHPPAKDLAAWQAVLADADQMTANSERQVRAARTQDATAFVTTVHTANDLIDRINADADRLGISAGSPCHQVYG